MESPNSSLPDDAQIAQAKAWWNSLSDTWKRAFNEVALRRSSTEPLDEEMLWTVFSSPNHRFAGPTAPYPNMSFELEDLSGIIGLPNIELAILIHHKLNNLRDIGRLKNLRSLFVHNNELASLEGLEVLTQLKELYCNVNQITSLKPLEELTNLHTLYCNYNLISTLDGIGVQHGDNLENFYCLPNPNLKDSVAMRFERE
ncbi:MAG: leucine-rich repeat domain-containing protein, partial [Saprospiraceae bacterium]